MKVTLCFSLLVLCLASTPGETLRACSNNLRGRCVNLDTTYCRTSDYYVNSGCPTGYTCCSRYVKKLPRYISNKDQCGVPYKNLKDKVVGGAKASIQDYPWMVSVRKFGEHLCGGSIIGDRWILTAAHCIDKHVDSFTVHAGSGYSDYPTFANVYNVDSIHYHTEFDPDFVSNGYDIALLRLEKPISLGSLTERRICLPDSTENFHNRICVATGWGSAIATDGDKYGDDITSNLKEVILPVISNKQCAPYWRKVVKGVICAGYKSGGDDTCVGDSGGPLVCQDRNGFWKQAGIVSIGRGCAQPQEMGAYTDVAYFRKWIDDVMNDY